MKALEEAYAEINGVRLHYVARGKGPLVLLLHGFPEFWYAWRHQLDDLGHDFRVVAPDTRGINLSSGPEDVASYHLDTLVEDVRQLIAHLGYERAVLVGHDWGGFIAWETAIRYPALIDRLVILNAAHPGIFDRLLREGGAQAEASRYMLAFRSSRGEELLSRGDFAAFRANILEPGLARGQLDRTDAERYLKAWRRPGSLTAGLNYYRANKSGPLSGDDPRVRSLEETRITVPTRVIWGEKDPYFVPQNLDLLPLAVPDLLLHRFPDADHWVVHQHSREVSALLRR